MNVYMVERDLTGITMEQLGAAQKAAIQASEQFSETNDAVRYLRSTFVPGTSRCLCLFEAANAKDVETVNRNASLPFENIVEALDIARP